MLKLGGSPSRRGLTPGSSSPGKASMSSSESGTTGNCTTGRTSAEFGPNVSFTRGPPEKRRRFRSRLESGVDVSGDGRRIPECVQIATVARRRLRARVRDVLFADGSRESERYATTGGIVVADDRAAYQSGHSCGGAVVQ